MSLSWNVFNSRATRLVLLRLRRRSISERRCVASAWVMKTRALAARSLRSVLGKSWISRSSSSRASGYQPASIRNRTTRSRSSAFFWSTRPISDMITECGTWLVSTTPTQKPSIPR